MPSITRRYEVASLGDLAEHFESRSKELDGQAERCRTQKDKHDLMVESHTWHAAAQILRDTTITPTKEN